MVWKTNFDSVDYSEGISFVHTLWLKIVGGYNKEWGLAFFLKGINWGRGL